MIVNPEVIDVDSREIWQWETNPSLGENYFLIKRPITSTLRYVSEDFSLEEK